MSGSTILQPSLHHLRAHSIFRTNGRASSSSTIRDEDLELVDAPSTSTGHLVGQKSSNVILREKDLIVAHGKNLRITNLPSEGWELTDGVVGSYRVCFNHGPFLLSKLISRTCRSSDPPI